MDPSAWFWFWVALSAMLIVAEVFTAGFFLFPFGVGAAVSAVLAWVEVDTMWQWAVFVLVSIPMVFFFRSVSKHTTATDGAKVGGDRLLGRIGLVLETVRPHQTSGLVRVGGEEWRAEPEGTGEIAVGGQVEVVRIDGVHLVVRPHESPEAEGGA